MVLPTNLKHFGTAAELTQVINEKENVMVCAGRMGPMCLPVYDVMQTLEKSGEYAPGPGVFKRCSGKKLRPLIIIFDVSLEGETS